MRSRFAEDRGLALLSVLWLIALLSVFAAGLISLIRTDSVNAARALEDARAESLADAGIYLVLHELRDARTAGKVPADGRGRTLAVDGRKVKVSVQDEAGKIDINFASKERIAALLEALKVPAGERRNIVEHIESRRRAFRQSQKMQDLPLHSIEELLQVPGMTDGIFRRVRPVVTVYSRRDEVVAAYASREVLLSLGGGDKLEARLADRRTRKGGGGGGDTQTEREGENMEGRAFTIMATAGEGDGVYSRRAVVRITGDIRQPYWILEWGRGD